MDFMKSKDIIVSIMTTKICSRHVIHMLKFTELSRVKARDAMEEGRSEL